MTKKTTSRSSANSPTQYIIPALVGAVVAGAAFALFLTFAPGRFSGPADEQTASRTNPLGDMMVLNDSQRTAIEKTVSDYLLNNPEILMKMSEALERAQIVAQTEKLNKAITDNSDLLFRDNYGLHAGNPDGDVTVVEFSDYNCPYCKRAFNDVTNLIESDDKVRVVLKEFPIFGERSEGAARVAIAAQKQGKYFEMHTALLQNRGPNNAQTALAMAEKLGLDIERIKKDMKSPEADKIIKETRELGSELGIQGTPFYLIGDRVVPGAPEDLLDVLKKHVADVRENGCKATC